MRTTQLRALLKELRAAGVCEFTQTKRGETVTVKLAGPFAQPQPERTKIEAKAGKPLPPISSELRKQLETLGVDYDQAHEVLRDVGIGMRGADGN